MTLPVCCHSLSDVLPWRGPLPEAQWISLRFDRQHLQADDFSRCAIPVPEAIQQAAPKRQIEFLAGRLCAREAIRRLTGITQVPAIAASKAPAWPDGLVGSITHSGDLAAALVASSSRYQGIGLDAERQLDTQRGTRLAGQILTPGEREYMTTLPADQRGFFVTLVFSLKESLFKALFPLVGVRFYFQDAQVVGSTWDRRTQQVSLRLLKPLAEDWPAGSLLSGQYAHHEHYLISLVSVPA